MGYSSDRQLFASASDSKAVRLGDPRPGACRATFKGYSDSVSAVAFSPDGKFLASASDDKTVRLWDPTAGTGHATLEGHSHPVRAVAFSPDGKLVASASDDKTIRLWDPTTGASCATLKGHSGAVWAVAFSPDGKHVVSTSDDWTTHFFNVNTVSPIVEEIYPTRMESQSPTSSPFPLCVNGHLICYGMRKLFFVPPDYRTNGFAIRNNVIALTHQSGTVHFIQLDLDSVSLGEHFQLPSAFSPSV
jgi:WD40 repeat protein